MIALHPLPKRPHGLDQIIATFGDPAPYADNPAAWERRILVFRALPTPLPLAGFPGKTVSRFRAHALVADQFLDTIVECLDSGISAERLVFGGIYAWRLKRGVARPSVHTWGIGIDIDPTNNPLGEPWKDDGRMLPPQLIDIWKRRGWKHGNDWTRPDPQHFQWATGY